MSFWNGREWVGEEPTATDVKREGRAMHVAKALLEASLITALTFGLIAGSAFAAKGGRTGGSSAGGGGGLEVVMVYDANGNGAPNWNDQITFNVTTTATDKPWVLLNCYVGGHWVSTTTHGFFPAYPWGANYTLASGGWAGGAGDCTATLYKVTSKGRQSNISSLSFHVDA
jgi:hypothetical protein